MTQIVRYGRMLKAELNRIRIRVELEWEQTGSLLAGTLLVRCRRLDTHLEVDSPDPPALVAAVIHNAKAGCFAEAAFRERVETSSTVALNDRPFDYQRFPMKPPRTDAPGPE